MSSRPADGPRPPTTLAEALVRLEEAEHTLRAIGAGEVDAFVVSDGGQAQRVFTLATADRPYRMFVENMREGAATLSPSGVILYANRRLAEILRCSGEALVGTPLVAHVAPAALADGALLHPGREHGSALEFDLVDADGRSVPVLVGSSPLEVDGNDLLCLTFTDISAQRAQEREIARLGRIQGERMVDLQNAQAALMRQATHDALTGLPNRSLLVDRIDQALAQSRRSGRCVAVLFVDLDGFKIVNDTKGHAAGDLVLCTAAERLAAALRPTDTVARVGGDEFAVLAPEVDDRAQALDISIRLVGALDAGGRAEQGVGASVGMTVSVAGRGTAETLLYEADTAMYQAKSLGGQRVEVFDAALGRQLQQRAGVRRMLQSALDDRRVIVRYQPIVDLPSGRVAGYEALARISLPDGSILAPADFIAIAESTGLVLPLGTQVLELACQQASTWQHAAPTGPSPTVAVNLSARQFEPGNLTDVVQGILGRSGLSPTCLHLELTETATFDLRPALLRQLGLLADLGVQIGLDDFGTGYASLTHLRRLPVTFVKIDQSFVQGLTTDQGDERIVAAVVDLAANLGLRSIAEGVESQAQMDRLEELGCDQAQGYLFARPMPAADLPLAIAPKIPAATVRRA